MTKIPTNEQLQCLNTWPESTIGHNRDKELIAHLNQLCQDHGYGRVEQLTSQIREIWDNPGSIKKFTELRKRSLDILSEFQKELQNEKIPNRD